MIGIGKGTVDLADFDEADLILVIGQNPGSNHPRMLTTLQAAARRGCKIVSINPLRERGLVRFKHPQEVSGIVGRGTELADRFVRVKVGGDVALLKGVMKELLAIDAERDGEVLDRSFIEQHCEDFEAVRSGSPGHSVRGPHSKRGRDARGDAIARRAVRKLGAGDRLLGKWV